MTDLSSDYWAVLSVPFGDKNTASILKNLNSVNLWYVSESYRDCVLMCFKKLPPNLGGKRLAFDKNTVIARLSPMSITKILKHRAELSSDCYDEDFSEGFKAQFARKLYFNFVAELMMERRLDFRLPDAGIELKSSDV